MSDIEKIEDYYFIRRQVGHTTAMLNGAYNSDCIVYVIYGEIEEKLKGTTKPLLMITLHC